MPDELHQRYPELAELPDGPELYAITQEIESRDLAIDRWRERAEKAELVIARAENLRDKWLAWPPDDMHHAAGLMLAMYLDPRPAALDDQGPEHG